MNLIKCWKTILNQNTSSSGFKTLEHRPESRSFKTKLGSCTKNICLVELMMILINIKISLDTINTYKDTECIILSFNDCPPGVALSQT